MSHDCVMLSCLRARALFIKILVVLAKRHYAFHTVLFPILNIRDKWPAQFKTQ